MDSYQMLLDIVRELIRPPYVAQQEHTQERINEQYIQSSKNLDDLLFRQSDTIYEIVTLYSTVSGSLKQFRQQSSSISQDLRRCKQLLHLKRDELKQLYLGHVELETSVKMLTDIKQLSGAPARLQKLLSQSKYLAATRQLSVAQKQLAEEFANVSSLQNVRIELTVMSKNLYQSLLSETIIQMYNFDEHFNISSSKAYREVDVSQIPSPTLSHKDDFVLSLIESLFLLDKLPQTMQTILERLNLSLTDIVTRHTENAVAYSYTFKTFVVQLLKHFSQVIYRHGLAARRIHLVVLKRPSLETDSAIARYLSDDENPVLLTIKRHLKALLTVYLNVRGDTMTDQSAEAKVDLNLLLSKRRMPVSAPPALFKFAYSSHAVGKPGSGDSDSSKKGELTQLLQNQSRLMCSPAQANVVDIYDVTVDFLTDLRVIDRGQKLELDVWLDAFVKDTFLVNEKSRMVTAVTADPFRLVIPRVPVPLFQSIITLYSYMTELRRYAKCMVYQRKQVLSLTISLLTQFANSCQQQVDYLILSATCSSHNLLSLVKGGSASDFSNGLMTTLLAKDEQQGIWKAREIKELKDHSKVATVATLYESMMWLNSNIRLLFSQQDKPNFGGKEQHQEPPKWLQSQLTEFQSLGDFALNVLYLEAALRACNYLKDFPSYTNFSVGVDDIELDSRITNYLDNLNHFKKILRPILSNTAFNYVFSALGTLVCSLMMKLMPNFTRINPLGVKKIGRNLFELQKATGGSQVAFTRVRELFDLLLVTPDQVLNQVLEQGPKFSEEEYTAVFRVYSRTYTFFDDNAHRNVCEKLKHIMQQQVV